jgi:hypothetical protein
MADCHRAARYYAGRGFSVIPVGLNKNPLLKWRGYQKERANDAQIAEWWTKWPQANVGIVTGSISGICVVDVDTDEGRENIGQILPDALLFPSATTPRGGQHFYFRYPDNMDICNNAGVIPGCDFRGEGGYVVAPPSVNGEGKAYSWTTGLEIHKVDMPVLPDEYIRAVRKLLRASYGVVTGCDKELQVVTSMFVHGRRDNDLFHVANCLAKGGMPEEECVHVIRTLMASWGENDAKWATDKVRSAYDRKERMEGSLAEEVRQWLLLQDGYFSVTDCYKELHLVTKEEKSAARVALHRAKGKEIEKYGDKAGHYRRVDGDCEILDFMAAPQDHMRLELPFKLNQLVHVYPKNICIIAGTFDSGKTAFLMEVARMNMREHKVHYFSSEMGEQELRRRLEKTGEPLSAWQAVDFRERSGNFADVIHPDDINIIDFLEIHEDAWLIGKHIRQIFDRLNKGAAFIGIQKKPGNDVGVGGIASAEKARLYINMDRSREDKRLVNVKIEKAKNWAQAANPNGLLLHCSIEGGCRFHVLRDWYREEK